MDTKELGSFNTAFDCEFRSLLGSFVDASIFELAIQAEKLICDPGKYQLVLIVNELKDNK